MLSKARRILGIVLLCQAAAACTTVDLGDSARDNAYSYDEGALEFSHFMENAGNGASTSVPVPSMGPQAIQVDRKYFAASGNWCRQFQIGDKTRRTACRDDKNVWYVVPDIRAP